jgi:hypothetical protein
VTFLLPIACAYGKNSSPNKTVMEVHTLLLYNNNNNYFTREPSAEDAARGHTNGFLDHVASNFLPDYRTVAARSTRTNYK